ncbi:DUF2303 family protein [Mycobacterium aquaticum]|uniref:DUF2303 domain-containing protein n=1 Tax=Mycobacterium aquaticum TaxID=1927124 RepID=A0A1X0A000_9MYCO|nr:DUF2303 family protein [Mycobacterium aquaticum]ORA23423.1 hypothetical protein BST13_35315 [Mycobacterium aquaticum]
MSDTNELADLAELAAITTASVEHAPHEAQIVDSTVEHLRHAVAVTENGGLQVKAIDDRAAALEASIVPLRAKGTRTVSDVDSFLHELDRRPLPLNTGTLWGNADRGKIDAIYNDHASAVGGAAGWRDDILTLKLTDDPDWVAWHKISGQYMPQGKFGDTIEELRHCITSPDQADLLLIIDSIKQSTKGEFESAPTRANGALTYVYKMEVARTAGVAGRELEVPEHIMLSLRPWEGHPKLYDVPAYFRTDVVDGHLLLAVKLFPTREIVRQAWADLTAQIVDHLDLPVYAQP